MRIPIEVIDLALPFQLSVRMHHDTGAYEIWSKKHLIACTRPNEAEAIVALKNINRRLEERKELVA